ncbi:MAG: TIGR03943 family putative permease subunit [Actinomycetota bacterium]
MTRKLWSPTRVVAVVVIGCWAGLFWFLWLGGRSALFVGPRTAWVVPAGAVILTVAAVGRLVSARVDHIDAVRRTEVSTAILLLLPVAVTLALPPTALGSFAATRRSSFAGGELAPSVKEILNGDLTFQTVGGARSPEARAALRERTGEPLTLEGFVTHLDDAPADGFTLSRFVITCCVADALAVHVPVEGDDSMLEDDDWVRVSGTLMAHHGPVVLHADAVVPIERPDHPYLRQ